MESTKVLIRILLGNFDCRREEVLDHQILANRAHRILRQLATKWNNYLYTYK